MQGTVVSLQPDRRADPARGNATNGPTTINHTFNFFGAYDGNRHGQFKKMSIVSTLVGNIFKLKTVVIAF